MRVHAPQIAAMLTAIAKGEVPGPGYALDGVAHTVAGGRSVWIHGWHIGADGFKRRWLKVRPFEARSPADALDCLRTGLVAALYGAGETV